MGIVIKGKTIFGPNTVTDGLVLNLDAANPRSYPGSGTSWYDIIGGNNGSLINGPTFDSQNGGTILFDGVDDKMRLRDSIPLTTSCTFNQWIRPSSGSATTMASLSYYSLGTAKTTLYSQLIKLSNVWYHQVMASGHPSGYAEEMNIYYQSDVTQYVVNNTPYNFCFTWERVNGVGSTLKTYLNGSYREQSVNTNTYWSNTASLETAKYEIYQSFKGNIGILSAYNRVLTAAEIQQNYNSLKGRFGL